MRDCDHSSTSAAFQTVQLEDNFIGFGNTPALTHDQIVDGATPPHISRTRGNL
jgi:hypothetical protein